MATMSDLFQDKVPFSFIDEVIAVISKRCSMRSKSSPYVSQVAPAVGEVVEAIASKTGEC